MPSPGATAVFNKDGTMIMANSQQEGELVITSRNGAEFTIWFPAGTQVKNTVPASDS